MTAAYVMIGAPGSGKTTRARVLADVVGALVVSTDTIREELYGSERIQGDWAEIKKVLERKVSTNVGNPVILDATHYRTSYRREAINLLRRSGYETVIGVVVDATLEECLARNSARDREVPDHVVENMWCILKSQLSSIDKEGFTATIRI